MTDVSADMLRNIKAIQQYDVRILEGPYMMTEKMMKQDELVQLLDITGNVSPGGAKVLLPRIIAESSVLPDAVEIAGEVAAIIEAESMMPTENQSGSGETPPGQT